MDTATFIQILGHFRESLRLKRLHVTRFLHMDNAPVHGSRDTRLHLLLTGQRTVAHLYVVRAKKEFPLVPTIFCVLPIHRSRL